MLPRMSSASLCEPRSEDNVPRTCGHHTAMRLRVDAIARLPGGDSSTPTITSSARPSSTKSRCDTSGELGSPRSRLTVALEKIRSNTRSTTWTMVLVKESIAPDVMAIAGATPGAGRTAR